MSHPLALYYWFLEEDMHCHRYLWVYHVIVDAEY